MCWPGRCDALAEERSIVKKAVVVGGSNGMGLAVSVELIKRGYFVEVADVVAPSEEEIGAGPEAYRYSYTNLLFFDEDLFRDLAKDPEVEMLVITAGIGRIADFQYHHIAEIEKTFTIDTVSTIKIIRMFYERIMGDSTFYTGVMGSIAGWMSSPCASVYAAAKAGVIRLIESVNIELELQGSPNRILDISPSSFKGSKFYGGKNNVSMMSELASQIVGHILARDTRFIPQYEEVFKGVLERYHNDPHEYGVHSYNYKESSGRKDNNRRVRIGYISGAFEPFNADCIKAIREAKSRCDYLIVGLRPADACGALADGVSAGGASTDGLPGGASSDGLSFDDRREMLMACKYVDRVVEACADDEEAREIWSADRIF